VSHLAAKLGPMTPDERVGRHAARQHGLITRRRALDLGVTPKQIRRRQATGRWLPLRREVYAIAGVPSSLEQAVLAAVLSARGRAASSHATAGVLWGMPGIEAERIELLVPLDRRLELDGVLCHRTGAFLDADLTRYRGIPITTPARTLVDLSGRLGPTQLGTICDNLLRRRQLRLADLRRCARRLEGAPGRRPTVVHEVLAARLPGYEPGDSDLETRVVRVLLAVGLPCPTLGLRVRAAGRT
jgi:predicted transcriptional regulator of viral defense system